MAIVHLVTPEYPPALGGVGDYTRQVAHGLARAGDEVHVWCRSREGDSADGPVQVHRALGDFGGADLREAGARLDRYPSPHRLIVQWVPHGYGRRAMNVPFCLWLARRSAAGDAVELMVHEPFLAFGEGRWRQAVVAGVHRIMTVILLRAASRVWLSIPAWEGRWRPYTFGRPVPFRWLPVPSALELPDEAAVEEVRARLGARRMAGHLGTYGRLVTDLLDEALPAVLGQCGEVRLLLIGDGSLEYSAALRARHPEYAARISATGRLSEREMAAAVAACDVLVQPYPDGVSSRRTTAMAGLALGVPIVTTRGHLTEPLWEDARIVRLVPVGDWRHLAAYVCEMLGAPEERRRLSDAARRFYDERFDLRHTIAALRAAA